MITSVVGGLQLARILPPDHVHLIRIRFHHVPDATPTCRQMGRRRALKRPGRTAAEWVSLVEFAEYRALEKNSWRNIRSTVGKYREFMASIGRDTEDYSFNAVASFMLHFVSEGNSTRSLGQQCSHLKSYNRTLGRAWLDATSLARLQRVIRGVQKYDHSVPRRKLPITYAVLDDMINAARRRGATAATLQLMAMCLVAHNGLMRGSEICKLRYGDILYTTADCTRATAFMHKTKANKTGPREEALLRDFGPCSALPFLRRHMDHLGAHAQDAPLFPSFSDTGRAITPEEFKIAVRDLLAQAGYPAGLYSGHSFRSGGATDLFHAGCRIEAIKFQGRWRSDAFTIYIRDNGPLRAKEVFAAFADTAVQST